MNKIIKHTINGLMVIAAILGIPASAQELFFNEENMVIIENTNSIQQDVPGEVSGF